MSNEKMREEFEAWYSAKYQIAGAWCDTSYAKELAFDAWRASRAALCVEFTKPRETDSSGLPCYDEYWREDVEDMLNAAGIRYK